MTDIEANRLLIEVFPFLKAPNEDGSYDYSWTFLDFIIAKYKSHFIDMCWEIKNCFIEEEFFFIEVKEKYGKLRVYCSTYIEEVEHIIASYWKDVEYIE